MGPVRWSWQVAGALDCLRSGRSLEAQARLGLLLAAADQAAIDAGSWLLSAEMLLEPGPPLASFSKHRPPESWEDRKTKLLDPRVFSVLIHRIREREAFQEARKKLGSCSIAQDPPPTPNPRNPDAERPSRKKTGKGKGKESDSNQA